MLSQRYSLSGGSLRARTSSPTRVTAAVERGTRVMSSYSPTSTAGVPTSQMPIGGMAYNKFFTGISPENEEALIPYYRDLYYYDSVAGAAVDMIGTFPFSNWTLVGLDKKDMDIYNDNMSKLNFRALLPEISLHHLVDGAFIGSLVYDARDKTFQDVLIHDRLSCQISPRPFFSLDPVITVNSSSNLQQYLGRNSPYVNAVMSMYPKGFLDAFLQGSVDLDPFTTIYLPRKTAADSTTTSYLKRLLPMYYLEKTLYRGTLIEATKRMRATSHVQIGTDTWEPTPAEMQMVLSQFQMAELDPLGAWVVTRQGVQVQDIRQAGEMWKWTDVVDSMVPYKLRALGIHEAFLSGEATYACLAGDSLIPTTEGLRRIDSFGEGRDRKKVFPVKAVMDSRYKPQKASSWQYNGYQSTLRLTTDTGHSIQATGNHPLLVFNTNTGETEWKRADKLAIGDILCISKNRVVRSKPLRLNVPKPKPRDPIHRDPNRLDKNGQRRGFHPNSAEPFQAGDITVPTHMSPKLAYWLALFISEGFTAGEDIHCATQGLARTIGFSNTDRGLVDRFASLGKELFGVQFTEVSTKTSDSINKSAKIKVNHDYHSTRIANRRLVDWLDAIGVYVKPGRVNGKTPSHFKSVPWSILQADAESQTAFLAAYAECDGYYGKGRSTTWISVSESTARGILAILNSHGYAACLSQPNSYCYRVTLYTEDSHAFWKQAQKYLSAKKWVPSPSATYSKLDGVPVDYWVNLIRSRKVRFDRHGQYFLSDDKTVFVWSRNKNSVAQDDTAKPWGFAADTKRFNYTAFDEGKYDGFVAFLKRLSPEAHSKFLRSMRARYRYSPIVSIADAGKEHVYDISMPAGKEPAFVANGLVVHNTAETAMSVFTENMAAYREFLTHRLFRDKFFPLIAVSHDMYVNPSDAAKERTLTAVLRNLSNSRNLRIPEIRWHKNMDNHDPSVMDTLEKLGDKGIPVPLKMWAAAANVDMGMLLGNLEEDNKIRSAIEEITGVKPTDAGGLSEDEEGLGDDGFGEESSSARFRKIASNLAIRPGKSELASRRVGVLNRDYGNSADAYDAHLSKSGNKVHASFNSRAKSAKMNDYIIKAMRALQDPHHRKQVRDRIAAKNGGRFPNLINR